MKRRSARGLTLIELLVIIGILFVLGAILFPVFARPRGCYRRSCLSNMKQFGLATAMYLQDYDDTFPWNPDPGGLPAGSWAPAFRARDCAPQPTASFVTLLWPYVKNRWVFRCPWDDGYGLGQHLGYTKSLAKLARESGDDPEWINRIGYGFNEVLIGSPCRPRTLSSLKHNASEVALFSDAEQPWASSTNTWAEVDGEWGRFWTWDPITAKRHERRQHFVYADGRAKLRQPVWRDARRDRGGEEVRSGYYPDAKLE